MPPATLPSKGRDRLELDALKGAIRWLARERRQPDMGGLDPAASADLAEIARLLNGDAEAASNPLVTPGAAPAGSERFLVLAKAERHHALRLRGGDALAGELQDGLRRRLAAAAPEARIGRVGAGVVEFCLVSAPEALEGRLSDLHAGLEQPFTCGGEAFTSAVMLGATPAPEGVSLSHALSQAQQALARAEADGMKLAVFCEQERADASERLALMRDLRAAIRAEELTLVYQPKLNLRTRSFDSAEALLRWRHPRRGEVTPDQFIALAEDTGDIDRITESVLSMAVRDQAALATGGAPPMIHINLSGRLVADEDFCRRALAICATATGKIGMEITETAVIAEPGRALRNLHAFVEAGVAIAIDDYGTGLSSLAYLKALPASELKIDKAFVLGLTTSHRDPLIVRSTIDLAHALDMQVTAEGVDDATALALLQVMGCDRVQGFHISRPLALEDLRAFLAAPLEQRLTAQAGKGFLSRAG